MYWNSIYYASKYIMADLVDGGEQDISILWVDQYIFL
jgi:hypothetical protein